ncbi:3-hydroxybutyrate dehydrogenase [Pelagibacteraceae bacterium]|jgi:3-hydroxybutyrate dehydrogenase|nr:3-hydroxybutyrate dehydrogenase [Pelagibacteraceae bacterium]|tara:strand:- start:745 stop:1512 length:768 start_codon:yes stop_codon:yes gene_type:complete
MNKTILVTGGGGDIGFSIVQYFYQNDYNVIIAGHTSLKKIKQIKKKINSKRSLIFNIELNRKKNIQKIIKQSKKKFSSIDILVNCAGIQFVSPIEKYPEKIWRKMMDINLTVPFLMIKETLPLMRKNKFGRIINIASTHGLISSINKSAYTASKHGLVGLTKGVALETAKENITCNSICPGFVLTNLIQDQIDFIAKKKNISNQKAQIELLKEKQPSLEFVKKEDIAAMIYFLSSKEAKQITGSSIPIDGAWISQ